jgi:hypothetical protein
LEEVRDTLAQITRTFISFDLAPSRVCLNYRGLYERGESLIDVALAIKAQMTCPISLVGTTNDAYGVRPKQHHNFANDRQAGKVVMRL